MYTNFTRTNNTRFHQNLFSGSHRHRIHCRSVKCQVYFHVESDNKLGNSYIANGTDEFSVTKKKKLHGFSPQANSVTALKLVIFDKFVRRPPIHNFIQINLIVPNLRDNTL